MFSLVFDPIQCDRLKESLRTPRSGALVTFEGWVRNHNEGKEVLSLEYEAYPDLVLSEAEKILAEARERFGVESLAACHRIGALQIGEVAVWVGATSAHRDLAFEACQYVIDELKVRLPIWKKEFYADGQAEWVNCQQCAHSHSKIEHDYYSRQIRLPEMGALGQKKLSQASVLIVGAGGLGCPAATYLTAAGVGHLAICDGDQVELSNLHRQTLYRVDDVGKPKAPLAATRLSRLNPQVHFSILPFHLRADQAASFIEDYDLVLDCTDNFRTKFLIHDLCYMLKKPLLSASIYQFEGQIRFFPFHKEPSGCLRCLWPEIPQEGCVANCVDAGVLGATAGVLGSLQASETLKFLLGLPMKTETTIVNLMTLDQYGLTHEHDPDCPLCGKAPSLIPFDRTQYEPPRSSWELNESIFGLDSLRDYEWIDIRKDEERDLANQWENKLTHLPFESNKDEPLAPFASLDRNKKYLLVCSRGQRSKLVTESLRKMGFDNFFSFQPGVGGLRRDSTK